MSVTTQQEMDEATHIDYEKHLNTCTLNVKHVIYLNANEVFSGRWIKHLINAIAQIPCTKHGMNKYV